MMILGFLRVKWCVIVMVIYDVSVNGVVNVRMFVCIVSYWISVVSVVVVSVVCGLCGISVSVVRVLLKLSRLLVNSVLFVFGVVSSMVDMIVLLSVNVVVWCDVMVRLVMISVLVYVFCVKVVWVMFDSSVLVVDVSVSIGLVVVVFICCNVINGSYSVVMVRYGFEYGYWC